jgi:hypothetical protein
MKIWVSLTDSKNMLWIEDGDLFISINENGSLYFEDDPIWKRRILKNLDSLIALGEWEKLLI